MYTLVSALLREKGKNKPYAHVDISNMKLSAIYSTYLDGIITLKSNSLVDLTHVELGELKSATNLPYIDLTFNLWLAAIANTTIFTKNEGELKVIEKVVSFSDAIQAGYTAKRVHASDIRGSQPYPSDQLRDIWIYKPVADQTLLHRKALTTVNGLCHINIPSGTGLLIKEGGSSFYMEQDNHIGILSFENIGDVTQIHIKPEMLSPSSEFKKYRQAMYVNLKRDLRNKSIAISIAGKLLINQGIIDVVNLDGVIRINTGMLDLFKMIQELIGKVDTAPLKLDHKLYHDNALTPENCTDDETILALFSMMQTFLVIVDSPNLVTERQPASYTNSLGHYEMFTETKLPYISDTGELHAYWKINHPEKYCTVSRLHVKNNWYKALTHQTTGEINPKFRYGDQYQYVGHRQFNNGSLLKIYSTEIYFE